MDRHTSGSTNISIPQQDTYWYLRSEITRTLASDWDAILLASPATLLAQSRLDLYLERNPRKAFQVFRPEDLEATHQHGGRLFFR